MIIDAAFTPIVNRTYVFHGSCTISLLGKQFLGITCNVFFIWVTSFLRLTSIGKTSIKINRLFGLIVSQHKYPVNSICTDTLICYFKRCTRECLATIQERSRHIILTIQPIQYANGINNNCANRVPNKRDTSMQP